MAFSSTVQHGREEEGGGDEAEPMPQRAIVHGEQSEPRSRSLPTLLRGRHPSGHATAGRTTYSLRAVGASEAS